MFMKAPNFELFSVLKTSHNTVRFWLFSRWNGYFLHNNTLSFILHVYIKILTRVESIFTLVICDNYTINIIFSSNTAEVRIFVLPAHILQVRYVFSMFSLHIIVVWRYIYIYELNHTVVTFWLRFTCELTEKYLHLNRKCLNPENSYLHLKNTRIYTVCHCIGLRASGTDWDQIQVPHASK